MEVLYKILLGLGGLIIGVIIGIFIQRKLDESEIGSATEEANRILNEAIKESQNRKKEALVEAKEEIYSMRTEVDREIKEKRNNMQKQENRISQKEDSLDKKISNADKKETRLNNKLDEVDDRLSEIEKIKVAHLSTLEKIAELSQEKAKEMLLEALQIELDHEKAVKLSAFKEQLHEESESEAQKIISTAMQRVAADHVSETSISVVPLPNDEMKGRIIGREGRNIRSLESLTGVDLIIDDTPEAITLSSFDPVRREVARMTLEKLIADGRIHPSRVEDMYEKSKLEVEKRIKKEGEAAVMDLGVPGVHPELIKLLGRLFFRTSYGQNVLYHSIEVAYLSGMMAAELGADETMARRAGLFHDIGKALDHEYEGSHVQIGVEVAKRYKEKDEVISAIQTHHNDIEPTSVIDFLVQTADAISAARPGARRENIENYIRRLEKLEEIASSFDGVYRTFAIQAGREIRIMVEPEKIDDDQMTLLAYEIGKKIEEEMNYPGQIKVHLVRESRAVNYAK